MSSKAENYNDRQAAAKQPPSRAETSTFEALARPPHSVAIVQRARLAPGLLTQNDTRHLQRTVGNQVVMQLLSAQQQVIQRTIPGELTWKGKWTGIGERFTRRSKALKAIFTTLAAWHDKKDSGSAGEKLNALMTLLRSIDAWLPTKKGKWLTKHADRIQAVKDLRKSVIDELTSCVDESGYTDLREFLKKVKTSDSAAGWEVSNYETSEKALAKDLPNEANAGMHDYDPPTTRFIQGDEGETTAHFAFSTGAGPCVIIMMRARDQKGNKAVGAIHRPPGVTDRKPRSIAQWQAVINQLKKAVMGCLKNPIPASAEFYVTGGQDDPRLSERYIDIDSMKSYVRLRIAFAAENIKPRGWSVPITLGYEGSIDARIGPHTVSIEMVERASGGTGKFLTPTRWPGTRQDYNKE